MTSSPGPGAPAIPHPAGPGLAARLVPRAIGGGVGLVGLLVTLALVTTRDCVTAWQSHVLATVLALAAALLLWGVLGGLLHGFRLRFAWLGEAAAGGVAAVFIALHALLPQGVGGPVCGGRFVRGVVSQAGADGVGLEGAQVTVKVVDGGDYHDATTRWGEYFVHLSAKDKSASELTVRAELRGFAPAEQTVPMPIAGALHLQLTAVDGDGDGYPLLADCDDEDANNFPGNIEVCDQRDNNCDGFADFVDEIVDVDGDGDPACSDCDDSRGFLFHYPADVEDEREPSGARCGWRQVSAGDGYTCAIDSKREVRCWGRDLGGRTAAPTGPFVSVSAGSLSHTCGLDVDSRLQCWGTDNFGESRPPGGAFDAVSTGSSYGCALTGGRVSCWGTSFWGVQDTPPGTFRSVTVEKSTPCGLDDDGSPHCWGHAPSGEVPSGPFTTMSTGGPFACGIRDADRAVECWGPRFPNGQPPPAGQFDSLDCNQDGCCVIAPSGELSCFSLRRPDPLVPPPGRFVQVSIGGAGGNAPFATQHGCAISTAGLIECWGNNDAGQTVVP